uniref:ATP synthase F0 subunit 8 n=1 Tax=Cyphipelta rufocyanea TaxID=115272 RepID=UPI0026E2E6BC|nr:ATP synthase F0 subunit 8 [Cyphipelta rufocyanea]WJW73596.1 ATP synthase F0 subunit 8 [Cyphipelta rufocyanea]
MPQMAPINWLSLFLLFSLIYILFNAMNYFIYTSPMSQSKNTQKILTNSMNWKW